jgi:hypothetical protein
MEMNPGNDSRRPELPSRPSSTRRRRSFGLKKTKQSEAKRLVIDRGPRRNVRLTIDPVCPTGHLPPPGIYLELRFRKTPKRPYHASADPSRQGGRKPRSTRHRRETHMESVHHRILQQEQTSRGDLFRRSKSSGEHAIPLHGVFEILNPVSGLHQGRNY